MSDTHDGFRQVREALEANNQIITFEGVQHYIVGIEDYETSLATLTRLEAEHADLLAERDRLAARCKAMEGALTPFANIQQVIRQLWNTHKDEYVVRGSDCRRAAAVLRE